MDDCAASPDQCDAFFTYEALAIEMNQDRVAKGLEPMTVVYPQGSLAFADSLLAFLPHGDNSEKKANFEKLQKYLLSPDAQQALLKLGRRPVNSSGLSLPRGCLARAADIFRGYGGGDTRKKAVVLMTDGNDDGHDSATIAELAAMHIPVIAIGFGDVDEHDLRDVIAEQTDGTYIHKDDVVSSLRDAAGFS
jgi:hypothetical protein